MSTLDRPIEDDDISHDSEAYRRWKGGTDNPLQSKQDPTVGLDTAIPLAFMSFLQQPGVAF